MHREFVLIFVSRLGDIQIKSIIPSTAMDYILLVYSAGKYLDRLLYGSRRQTLSGSRVLESDRHSTRQYQGDLDFSFVPRETW